MRCSSGSSLSMSDIPGMPERSAIEFVRWYIVADTPSVPTRRISGCILALSLYRSYSSSKISSKSSTFACTDSDQPLSFGFTGRRLPNLSFTISTPDTNVISALRWKRIDASRLRSSVKRSCSALISSSEFDIDIRVPLRPPDSRRRIFVRYFCFS